jgi:Family of unknown function (DUF6169)
MGNEKPIDPYEYSFAGGSLNSYFFTTIDAIIYEIKFIPSTDYFNAYPDVEIEAFEMTISVADSPTGNRLPSDKRTAPTIFAIFADFFLPKTQIIVFICDSSDGRAKARNRKFDLWFRANVRPTDLLEKLDRGVLDGDGIIYISLIFSRLNPNASRIMNMFAYLGIEDK